MVGFVSIDENKIPSVGLNTIFFTFSQRAPSSKQRYFCVLSRATNVCDMNKFNGTNNICTQYEIILSEVQWLNLKMQNTIEQIELRFG